MRAMLRSMVLAVACAGCAVDSSDVRIAPADFGVLEPGVVHHLPLRVQNAGAGAAKLMRVEHRSGASGFTVTPGQVQLDALDRAEWKVSFSSTALGLFEARFAAVFDTGVTEFTVRARVAERCSFAETFDVGDARVGHLAERTFTVNNPLDEPGEVFIGSASAPFSVEPAGTLHLAAHESREVMVRLQPQLAGEARTRWLVRPSTDCTLTEVTLAGRAVEAPLTFSPGRLDFGTLSAGSSRTRQVQVRNHTRGALTLTSLDVSTPAFRSATPLPLVVPAEGVAPLWVEALAASAEPFDAVLRVTTDAKDQPELRLALLANRASAPCLIALSSPLDLGSSEVGCRSHDVRVRVINGCPHEVRLGDRSLSPGFTFISSPLKAVLAPGQGLDFALVHSPLVAGEAAGQLSLVVDVLDGTQVLTVPLVGQGTPAQEVEESKVIPSVLRPLDVLLVIDDSPAMLPLADSIAENLGNFVLWQSAYGLDFRVGAMTTDTSPSQLGRLRRTGAGAGWLDKPSPAALQTLTVTRGLSTSRSSCLETLVAAFSGPLRRDPSELGGLLRPGAGLYVICITNTRDGLETAPMAAISTLLSAFPRPFELAAVASFVEVPGCTSQLEHGPLTALVAQTNGIREELCTPRWSISLERIGRSSFGYPTNFFLNQRASLTRGPVRVFIDGVEIPPVDPSPGGSRIWEYDGHVNSVNFEPLYVPAPGQTLRFLYTPDCAR